MIISNIYDIKEIQVEMIRSIENKDIDKIMNIWLRSTIKAHDFIQKEYWEKNYNIVKDIYIYLWQKLLYLKMKNA